MQALLRFSNRFTSRHNISATTLEWVTLLGAIHPDRNAKRPRTQLLPFSHQHDSALQINSSYVSTGWLSEQWKQGNSTWTFQLQSDEGICFSCRYNYSQLLYILKYQHSNRSPQTPLGGHSHDVGLLFLQSFGSTESSGCFSTQHLWKYKFYYIPQPMTAIRQVKEPFKCSLSFPSNFWSSLAKSDYLSLSRVEQQTGQTLLSYLENACAGRKKRQATTHEGTGDSGNHLAAQDRANWNAEQNTAPSGANSSIPEYTDTQRSTQVCSAVLGIKRLKIVKFIPVASL